METVRSEYIDKTMIPSSKPVIAVNAIRTGCGKSQTSRRVTHILKELGKKTEHLRVMTGGKDYAPDRMLMIGDAPKDTILSGGESLDGTRRAPLLTGEIFMDPEDPLGAQ